MAPRAQRRTTTKGRHRKGAGGRSSDAPDDPITRAHVRKDFKNLGALRSKTIILVTHDVQEAFDMADRILLMDNGRVIQEGTPDELLFHPSGDYVRSFLEEQRFPLEADRIKAGDYPTLIRAFDKFKNRHS